MTGRDAPATATSEPQHVALSYRQLELFLARPLVAVLSWLTPRREVASTPVWYEHRGGHLYVHAMSASLKVRSIAHHPQVSLCIQDGTPPYRYVTLRARARVIDDAAAGLALDERLARRYLGRSAARRYIDRIRPTLPGESRIIELTPTKLSSADGTATWDPVAVVATARRRTRPAADAPFYL